MRPRRIVPVCLILALLTSPRTVAAHHIPIAAQNLYGTITGDRILTAASPGPNYTIIGDLTIALGSSLLIERGVTVDIPAYSDFLASGDRSRVEIIVNGTLTIPGGPGFVRLNGVPSDATGLLQGSWVGIRVLSGGSASLVQMTMTNALIGVNVAAGASADVIGCTLDNVALHGVIFDPGSTGHLRESRIFGVPAPGEPYANGIGASVGGNIDMTPSDTTNVTPCLVSGFNRGIALAGTPLVRNVLALGNAIGFRPDAAGRINYCTAWNNPEGIVPSGCFPVAVSNSIVGISLFPPQIGAGIAGACGLSADHVDVWGYAQRGGRNFDVGPVLGPWVSSFDPDFVDATANNSHLPPTSFYVDFSTDGREIGAYGPGPGYATSVSTASVVSAGVEDGVVRVVWSTPSAPGERAVVQRRTSATDWTSQAAVQSEADGVISYEDRATEPGHTYEYALAVHNADGIAFEGHVTVAVPALTRFGIVSAAPSPTRGPCSVSLALHPGIPARLDVLDLLGRVRDSREVSVPTSGRGVVSLDLGSVGSPGVYWVRARQGETVSRAKVLYVR